MARKKKAKAKAHGGKQQTEPAEIGEESDDIDPGNPAEATKASKGLVEMAEALEADLNSAGVVEGRMLTRLLNASELVGSLCLALTSKRLETKWVVSSVLASMLLYTGGDPSVALLVVGGLINAMLGKLAKLALAQPRPNGATKTDNGMPSSHALLLSFFACYTAAFCLKMAYAAITMPKPSGVTTPAEQHDAALSAALRAAKWIVGAMLSVMGAAVLSWSRVDAGLHTVAQVAVGGLIGGGACSAGAGGAGWMF
jgi:membrane-associated phospholipid phosphatase